MPYSNKIINIDENFDLAISLAAELFRSGKIFIYPTDTIYGIGGNPFDEHAVKNISAVKGRDEHKKFIWLLPDLKNLLSYVEVLHEEHMEFLRKIWPAPVTVVLNLNNRTKSIINQNTVAVRIPENDFCKTLLTEISRPLISTSVNWSGQQAFNNTNEILDNFADSVDAVFITQQNTLNKASTVIDMTTNIPKLLREGSINFVELLKNFG